jgi:hypothetical protein
MAYDIELCDNEGVTMLGSDGHFNIDKRFGMYNVCVTVLEYRESFLKNFPHKAEYWTHFRYKGKIWKI